MVMGYCQVVDLLPTLLVQELIVPSEAAVQAWGDHGMPVQSPWLTYGQALFDEPPTHMRALKSPESYAYHMVAMFCWPEPLQKKPCGGLTNTLPKNAPSCHG